MIASVDFYDRVLRMPREPVPRIDDDSLHECLDRICSKPAEIYEIAEAGFALRDEEPFRSSGFNNLIELALQPAPVNITGLQDSRTPSLAL